mmetsp:Transcript_79184/g.237283  ORF Transcript_79184/g.237283 Transcript_79184/m.237283 type:complete len:219 (+) Transcript_79184:99-755(+)
MLQNCWRRFPCLAVATAAAVSRAPNVPQACHLSCSRRAALLYGLAAGAAFSPAPAHARSWYFRLGVSTEQPEPGNIFGKILRGEAYADVLDDGDDELFAFRDINPASDMHYLVIPRGFVRDAAALAPEDSRLVERMVGKARSLVQESVGPAFDESELALGFHWPPFYSVPWLHLHAIYPRSQMRRWYKYTPISFKSPDWVLRRLAEQRAGTHARGTWW